MTLHYLSRIKLVVVLIVVCKAILLTSCSGDQPSREALETALKGELPVGTTKQEIETLLLNRGIPYSDGMRQTIFDTPKSGRTYRTIVAAVDVDSLFFSNSKIIIDFYLDDNDRLVELKVQQTSSMP